LFESGIVLPEKRGRIPAACYASTRYYWNEVKRVIAGNAAKTRVVNTAIATSSTPIVLNLAFIYKLLVRKDDV
jgi:hypothetical protein